MLVVVLAYIASAVIGVMFAIDLRETSKWPRRPADAVGWTVALFGPVSVALVLLAIGFSAVLDLAHGVRYIAGGLREAVALSRSAKAAPAADPLPEARARERGRP
jgi:hypothetical protein